MGCLEEEERRISLIVTGSETGIYLDPGESRTLTVFIANTGDRDCLTRIELDTEDGWDRRNEDPFDWNLTFDDRITMDVDGSPRGTLIVREGRDRGNPLALEFGITVPADCSLGTRRDFFFEVSYQDERGVVETHRAVFWIDVGWITHSALPEETHLVIGVVNRIVFDFKNMVVGDSWWDTEEYRLTVVAPTGLTWTLTRNGQTTMSISDFFRTPPLDVVNLTPREVAFLTLWMYPLPDSTIPVETEVMVIIAPTAEPERRYPLQFALRIAELVHNVSFCSYPPAYGFDQGEMKTVAFYIECGSNVQETVVFTYSVDEVNWTLSGVLNESTFPADSLTPISCQVTAIGPVGTVGTLTIGLSYGPAMEHSEEISITLEVLF